MLSLVYIMYETSVPAPQRTQFFSIVNSSRFRHLIGVYCENNLKDVSKMCGQNAQFLMLKQVYVLL